MKEKTTQPAQQEKHGENKTEDKGQEVESKTCICHLVQEALENKKNPGKLMLEHFGITPEGIGQINICSCCFDPEDLTFFLNKDNWPDYFHLIGETAQSFKAEVLVDGLPMKACVDPKSEKTVLNLNKCKNGEHIKEKYAFLALPCRKYQRIEGFMTPKFQFLDGTSCECETFVAEITPDLIIGNDFISKFNGRYDQKRDSYYFNINGTETELRRETAPEVNKGQVLWVNKIHDTRSNLFTVRMMLEGQKRNITVDTAASKSLISRNFIDLMLMRPCRYQLLAANDGQLELSGECTLTLSAEGQQWTHTFLVHNQTSAALQVLLGNDFHDKFKSRVCFMDNTFSIPGEKGMVELPRLETSMEEKSKEENKGHQMDQIFTIMARNCKDLFSGHITVRSRKRVAVAAGKDAKIKVKFYPHKPTEIKYFQPREIQNGKIMAWDVLMEPDDEQVRVTNISKEVIYLKADTKLGFLVDKGEIRFGEQQDAEEVIMALTAEQAESTQKSPTKQETEENKEEAEEFNINPELSKEDREVIRELLKKNKDVFVRPGEPLRTTTVLQVRLPLKDPNKVIYQHNYSLNPAQAGAAQKVIDTMKAEKILEKAGHSNFRIPFMLVPKGKK